MAKSKNLLDPVLMPHEVVVLTAAASLHTPAAFTSASKD